MNQNAYDIEFPAAATLADARDSLARHILLTELVEGFGDSLPPSLASRKVARSPSGSDLSVALARNGRLRRDARDSYVAAAEVLIEAERVSNALNQQNQASY